MESQILEPMLYNNYVSDNDADFVFDRLPDARFPASDFRSHAGEILMTVLSVIAMALCPLAPVAAAAALPVMTLRKKKKTRRSPVLPERY